MREKPSKKLTRRTILKTAGLTPGAILVSGTTFTGLATAQQRIQCSDTVEGSLTENDPHGPPGHPLNRVNAAYDEYEFTLDSESEVSIYMANGGCFTDDPFLILFDDAENRLAYDDDSGSENDGCQARITETLDAGDYRIIATSYADEDYFDYTLELDCEPVNGDPDDPETRDDCKDGGYEDYGFRNQGQCIRFVNTGKDSRTD